MSSQSISEIHGINFFETPTSCISHYEKLPWGKKVFHSMKSTGTLVVCGFHKVGLAWDRVESKMKHFTNPSPKGFSKTKLVVCLHGLNGNPSQFKKIIEED